MKTNGAPEKIWIDNLDEGFWFDSPLGNKSIEYIRTDAFIEKVCEWLYDNLQTVRDVKTPSAHHVESIPALGIITQTEFVDKFKKEIRYLLD